MATRGDRRSFKPSKPERRYKEYREYKSAGWQQPEEQREFEELLERGKIEETGEGQYIPTYKGEWSPRLVEAFPELTRQRWEERRGIKELLETGKIRKTEEGKYVPTYEGTWTPAVGETFPDLTKEYWQKKQELEKTFPELTEEQLKYIPKGYRQTYKNLRKQKIKQLFGEREAYGGSISPDILARAREEYLEEKAEAIEGGVETGEVEQPGEKDYYTVLLSRAGGYVGGPETREVTVAATSKFGAERKAEEKYPHYSAQRLGSTRAPEDIMFEQGVPKEIGIEDKTFGIIEEGPSKGQWGWKDITLGLKGEYGDQLEYVKVSEEEAGKIEGVEAGEQVLRLKKPTGEYEKYDIGAPGGVTLGTFGVTEEQWGRTRTLEDLRGEGKVRRTEEGQYVPTYEGEWNPAVGGAFPEVTKDQWEKMQTIREETQPGGLIERKTIGDIASVAPSLAPKLSERFPRYELSKPLGEFSEEEFETIQPVFDIEREKWEKVQALERAEDRGLVELTEEGYDLTKEEGEMSQESRRILKRAGFDVRTVKRTEPLWEKVERGTEELFAGKSGGVLETVFPPLGVSNIAGVLGGREGKRRAQESIGKAVGDITGGFTKALEPVGQFIGEKVGVPIKEAVTGREQRLPLYETGQFMEGPPQEKVVHTAGFGLGRYAGGLVFSEAAGTAFGAASEVSGLTGKAQGAIQSARGIYETGKTVAPKATRALGILTSKPAIGAISTGVLGGLEAHKVGKMRAQGESWEEIAPHVVGDVGMMAGFARGFPRGLRRGREWGQKLKLGRGPEIPEEQFVPEYVRRSETLPEEQFPSFRGESALRGRYIRPSARSYTGLAKEYTPKVLRMLPEEDITPGWSGQVSARFGGNKFLTPYGRHGTGMHFSFAGSKHFLRTAGTESYMPGITNPFKSPKWIYTELAIPDEVVASKASPSFTSYMQRAAPGRYRFAMPMRSQWGEAQSLLSPETTMARVEGPQFWASHPKTNVPIMRYLPKEVAEVAEGVSTVPGSETTLGELTSYAAQDYGRTYLPLGSISGYSPEGVEPVAAPEEVEPISSSEEYLSQATLAIPPTSPATPTKRAIDIQSSSDIVSKEAYMPSDISSLPSEPPREPISEPTKVSEIEPISEPTRPSEPPSEPPSRPPSRPPSKPTPVPTSGPPSAPPTHPLVTPPAPPTPPPSGPSPTPPPVPPESEKGGGERGPESFVPQIRRRGSWINITEDPIEKEAAIKVAAREALETAGRSWRIVPTDEPPTEMEDVPELPPDWEGMFRNPESSELRMEGTEFGHVRTEKTEFAINTPGELEDITFKGLEAIQRDVVGGRPGGSSAEDEAEDLIGGGGEALPII